MCGGGGGSEGVGMVMKGKAEAGGLGKNGMGWKIGVGLTCWDVKDWIEASR